MRYEGNNFQIYLIKVDGLQFNGLFALRGLVSNVDAFSALHQIHQLVRIFTNYDRPEKGYQGFESNI